MKQIPLYLDSSNRYFYVTEDDVYCDSCGAELLDGIFIRTTWGKSSQLGLLCRKCTSSPMFEAQVEEWKFAQITYARKCDFTPVLIMFNGVKNTERDLTVFDYDKIKSNNTRDKTKHANRESWGGAFIGAPVVEESLSCSDVDMKKILGASVVVPDKLLLEDIGGKDDE